MFNQADSKLNELILPGPSCYRKPTISNDAGTSAEARHFPVTAGHRYRWTFAASTGSVDQVRRRHGRFGSGQCRESVRHSSIFRCSQLTMVHTCLSRQLKQPPGLTNLGNTCYMNASLQALRTIPELKTALSSYTSTGFTAPEGRLTSQLKSLFGGMDQTTEPIPPYMFLQTLRQIAPQFAEQSQHGGFAQQGRFESSTSFLIPEPSLTPICWNTPDDRRRRDVDPDRQLVAQLAPFARRGRILPRLVRGRLPLGRLATDVRGRSALPDNPARHDPVPDLVLVF
jgi:hypothetical protein